MNIVANITPAASITGSISRSPQLITGTVREGSGGSHSGSDISMGILNHEDFNFINGPEYLVGYQNGAYYTTKPNGTVFTINSAGEMFFSGYGKENIRTTIKLPKPPMARAIKLIVSVSNIGNYNSFGTCVAESVDSTAFRSEWSVAAQDGLVNPTPINWLTFFTPPAKNITVDHGTITIPLSSISTDQLILYMGQCENDTTIHEIWFE